MKAKNWSQTHYVFQGEARGAHGTHWDSHSALPSSPSALCPHWLSSPSVSLSTFSLHHTTVNCLWMCTALPTGRLGISDTEVTSNAYLLTEMEQ